MTQTTPPDEVLKADDLRRVLVEGDPRGRNAKPAEAAKRSFSEQRFRYQVLTLVTRDKS